MESRPTVRECKSPRKRFCHQHLATLATLRPTILRPASCKFPDGAIL